MVLSCLSSLEKNCRLVKVQTATMKVRRKSTLSSNVLIFTRRRVFVFSSILLSSYCDVVGTADGLLISVVNGCGISVEDAAVSGDELLM